MTSVRWSRLPMSIAFAWIANLLIFNAPILAAESSTRPNVVFILADDLGYGDLGCYGCTSFRTPNIDRLAREGIRFTNFYANGPECTPTRAAFITGRYQQRIGGLECAIGNGNVGRYDDAIRLRQTNDLGLPVHETSIARLLAAAGYVTGISGKWHLGYEDKFSPNRHGFAHAFYSLGGGMDYFHHVEEPPHNHPMLRLNGQPIERKGYFTDLVANDAVAFIAATKNRPFFLYVPFTAPHSPYQGPGDHQSEPLAADSPALKQGKAKPAVYAAMVESLDAAVGRIVAMVDDSGLGKNTLIVFTSDNGGTPSSAPSKFRGYKGTTFEGGIRVPCIVRQPGTYDAERTIDNPAITMDLTASIARLAGASSPRPFDGIDVLSFVAQSQPLPDRPLFWRGRRGERTWKAVRDGAWKYVHSRDGAKEEDFVFDLASDPEEKNNLASTTSAPTDRLKALFAEWETMVRPVR